MTLSARDKKIVLVIVPLVLVAAFWFLLLSPKWEEAELAGEELAKQEQRRDAAVAKLQGLESSRRSFAADYAAVVRLGKAVPASMDMPSLMVQFDRAAGGTGVDFSSVRAGDRSGAPAPASGAGASSSSAPGASSGGAAASGGGSGGGAGGTSTSSSAGGQGGGVPVGGGSGGEGAAAGSSAPGTAATSAPGLDAVPLQFGFRGSYFRLADFFHEAKRFVYVADDEVQVRGRLVTIDGFKLTMEQDKPGITAEITSSVYLTPKAQGPTGGASPEGPATSQASGSSTTSTSTAAATP